MIYDCNKRYMINFQEEVEQIRHFQMMYKGLKQLYCIA